MIITVTLNPAVDKTVTLPLFGVGKVNRIERMRMDPGGKGINVSKVIQSLGGESVAMGILGGAPGTYIRESLDGMGIEHDFLLVEEPTRTNIKIVDPELNTNTDINEPGCFISPQTLETVFKKVSRRVKPGDVVVLAGKTPPASDESIYGHWTQRLHDLGAVVYLDVDGPMLRLGVQALPDLIKPNHEEFSQLIGRDLRSFKEIARAAMALIELGTREIAISLGAEGVLFISRAHCVHAQGLKVPVRSTVGAGDATMAALAYGYAMGMPFEETAKLALASGAASVMCAGTEAASPDVVEELVSLVQLHPIKI